MNGAENKTLSSETKAKISESLKISYTPEKILQKSIKMKSLWENPEFRNKIIKIKNSNSYREKYQTQEFKDKCSKKQKKLWSNPIWKEKMVNSIKDVMKKEEVKSKISNKAKLRWKKPEFREKMKKTLSTADFHKKRSESSKNIFIKNPEARRKISYSTTKKNYKMWSDPLIKKEISQKISQKAKSRLSIPNNNPNWRGGISRLPYAFEFNENIKYFIRNRDNFSCKLCYIRENGKKHCVHHIDYNKTNTKFNNLITLCRPCHSKVHYNRSYWEKYFNNVDINGDIKNDKQFSA